MSVAEADATVERFIELVEGFSPGYADTIAPAEPDDVERLEELLERPLPPFYRAMLLRMGESLGDLRAFGTRDFSLELVLWWYESKPWELPKHFQLIGADIDDPAFNYFLDLRRPTGEDFEVVTYPRAPDYPKGETPGQKFHRLFATFQDMLFYSAFGVDRVREMTHTQGVILVEDTPEAEARFEHVIRKLGASPIPDLVGHARGYDASDFAAIAYRALDTGRWQATVGCDDKRRMGVILEVLADNGVPSLG